MRIVVDIRDDIRETPNMHQPIKRGKTVIEDAEPMDIAQVAIGLIDSLPAELREDVINILTHRPAGGTYFTLGPAAYILGAINAMRYNAQPIGGFTCDFSQWQILKDYWQKSAAWLRGNKERERLMLNLGSMDYLRNLTK